MTAIAKKRSARSTKDEADRDDAAFWDLRLYVAGQTPKSMTAFANLNRTPVDLQLVQTVLKDLITLDDDNVIAPVDIINHTADYFKLSVDDLYGSSRSQAVATARQIAMYLCRELTSLSLPKIGQLFGNRDHTTVMYANKKISELMKERRSIYNQVTELTSRIKQNQRYNKLS